MTIARKNSFHLPSMQEIRQAVSLYLKGAYPDGVPGQAEKFLPPAGLEPARWLLGGISEPNPPDAPLEAVRSFALRIGNAKYPNMKLRLTRPPKGKAFLFCVDSHDGFLSAEPGTADHEALEQLKSFNASVGRAIAAEWDAAGLPTERNYLRQKIRQKIRQAKAGKSNQPGGK